MSRSQRKRPIAGISSTESDKRDKIIANRKARRVNRILLKTRGEEALKAKRELADPKNFSKDGKARFDPKSRPRLMRK